MATRSKLMLEAPEYGYPKARLFHSLGTSEDGLSAAEAKRRLARYGLNQPAVSQRGSALRLFLLKFTNPLVVILIVISIVSWLFGERISAAFIGMMVFMSAIMSFAQEYRSSKAVEELRNMVKTTATVRRNGEQFEIDIKDLVPGDIVELNAGDIIPADLRLFRTRELFVDEASLTGESLPVEKFAERVPHHQPQETDAVAFMGSSVVSGTGTGVVVKTGLATQFGQISGRLTALPQDTSFERGINMFSWLMIRIIVVLAGVIFLINYVGKGNAFQAVLFALAVAVGLTPELLPMIITVNLSKGAVAMARKKTIVKKLNSIQNFGAMDILCTDKTGTLTENKIVLEKYCDVTGKDDKEVLRWAYVNASCHTGLHNLLDKAILKHTEAAGTRCVKVDEIPFDYARRMLSVIVGIGAKRRLVAKGAPEDVFKRCSHYELRGRTRPVTRSVLDDLRKEFAELSSQGLVVLAVAYRDYPSGKKHFTKEDENGLTLRGYVAFLDPPKASALKTIKALQALGIHIKVITGDSELVTEKICTDVGMDIGGIVTGDQVDAMNDAKLRKSVAGTTIYARLSPLQKERVIMAMRQEGHTVGYLGDGINDAPSLKAADVGISVNNAADIAKESAGIILLEKDLMVLRNGVVEGRKTFGNITKYIRMGASSNFGNMFSMTGGSFLPFLPMAPVHILLNNFLYDASQITIPSDEVDKEYVTKPRPWDIASIQRFLFIIGPLSSIFDFITFGVMWFYFHAAAPLFQTGWFIESLCTQTLIVHVIRTNKIPFVQSWPSTPLLLTTLGVVALGIAIPFTPLGPLLGFAQPPWQYFVWLAAIVVTYMFLVHKVMVWFVKKYEAW
jgi:Mg2+-importing ATPase